MARRLLARRRGVLLLSGLAFCVVGLAQLVAPWLMGRTVDVVLSDGDASTIGWYAVAIAAAAAVVGVASIAAQGTLARAAEPALAELREEVVDRVLHLDHQRVEEAGVGDLVSRVGDDVRTIGRSLDAVVPTMIGSAVSVVFTVGGLVALDWRLGLAGLVAAPAYVLGLRWYLPRSAPYYRRERIAQGERAEALVTGLHSAETLRAYRLEGHQLGRIRDASWTAAQLALDVWSLLTRFFARNNRAECLGLLAILVTGYLLVRDDAASVGEVTAATLLFHRLFNPVGRARGPLRRGAVGGRLTDPTGRRRPDAHARRAARDARPPVRSRSRASPMSTTPACPSSTTSTSPSRPASGSRWSVRPAPARRRSA